MRARAGLPRRRKLLRATRDGAAYFRALSNEIDGHTGCIAGGVTTTAESQRREANARMRVGTSLLSKWHLDALLGIGGMAAVYAATHRNGTRGAVKILHSDVGSEDTRRRFLREGKIANRVRHDGVVSVLDDDVAEDGNPFLVMELLEGEPLSSLAERSGNRVPTEVVLLLMYQALDALAAAHDQRIVHRDIKPENLFLTTAARVKLLDFGIARLAEPRDVLFAATQRGAAMGTPAFMSPEQARGRWDLVGPESDLWSVGATMFNLLTGEFVHDAATMSELLAAIITRPARSLAVARPGTPTSVVAIVDRALKQKMSERWHDARVMQAAVAEAYRSMTGSEIPRPSSPNVVLSGTRVSRWDVTTSPPARETISSMTTNLVRQIPRTLNASRIALVAAALALGIGSFVAVRSIRPEVVAARSFSSELLRVGDPPPRAEPAIPSATFDAASSIAAPASSDATKTSPIFATMLPTPTAARTSSGASATPIIATPATSHDPAPAVPDGPPKAIFDRRL